MTNNTAVSVWTVDDRGHAAQRVGLGVLSSEILVLIHTSEGEIVDRAAVLLSIRAGDRDVEEPAIITSGDFAGAVLFRALDLPTDPLPDLPDDVRPEVAQRALEQYVKRVREGVDTTNPAPGRPSSEFPLVRPLGLPDVVVFIARWLCRLLRCHG